MKKFENEEYNVDEILNIGEILHFEAEEFTVKEIVGNTMEDFVVKELQPRPLDETSKVKKKDNTSEVRKKLESIKSGINTAATTTVTASVAVVAALGAGTIILEPNEYFGTIEYINYFIEYEEVDNIVSENVKLQFKKDLNDGFYTIIINKDTEEIKKLNHDYITFYDIEESTTFEVVTKNAKDVVVDSFEIDVSTISNTQYLGIGNMNYELIYNHDNTYNLEMVLDECNEELIPKAFLSDLDGNDLGYQSSYYDNKLVINNITDTEFNLNAFLYKAENNNYFAVHSYKINNYNVNNPINADLKRVEVLNETYSYNGDIPTEIYIDGYLSDVDYLDVRVYNEVGEVIDESLNINDIRYPIIFYNLPTTQTVTFEYNLYHHGNTIKTGSYTTSLAIKEEYLNASYDYYSINPGDVLATYNKDGTYNAYFNSGFSNNSEYDMIYKVELSYDSVSHYEYIGNDPIGYIYNIDSDEQFSLIHKVMIREDKTYYSIHNFYLSSGTFGVAYDNGVWDLAVNVDVVEIDNHGVYQIVSSGEFGSDLIVTANLSTGQTIDFVISKDSLDDSLNYPTIDLTDYEYEFVTITVKVLANPIYGMGDLIIESSVDIIGDIYIEFILEYEFSKGSI